ncbi:MAG: TIGR04076 family protein [Muribaculaceae bacterium]|nr:TIGR04076 family protein [Muribaculaceae bacterium]
MDRRNFLKLSLAGVAACSVPAAAAAVMEMPQALGACRCRVSVVRRHCFADLQSCFLDDPEAGVCPVVAEDFQEEFVLAGKMPPSLQNKFCPKAWDAIAAAVAQTFSCTTHVSPAILASCGDPTRPVVFKIEKI